MSGFAALILSTTLLKSRVGVGCGMVSRIWKPCGGNCALSSLARPEPNSEVLVHDHHGLGRLAGLVVDGDEIVERGLGDDAEAGAEAERVLQPAADDGVGDADVDDIGQVVAGGGLADGEADRCRHSRRRCRRRRRSSSFPPPQCRPRASIAHRRAPHRSCAERLDAAGGVDLLDRHGRADAGPAGRNRTARRSPGAGCRPSRRRPARAGSRAWRALPVAAAAPSAVVARNLRRLNGIR